MQLVWPWLLLSTLFTCSFGARILGVFFCASYSHQIVFRGLYRELAKRGHEVIAVTPYPLNDPSLPNLIEIDTSHTENNTYEEDVLSIFDDKPLYPELIVLVHSMLKNLSEVVLNNTEFKKLYRNVQNEKFDLVLVEALSPLALIFGYIFNAPSIGIFSLDASIEIYTALGGVIHPAIYGGMLIYIEYPVSIWKKIQNIYYFLLTKYYLEYINRPVIDQMTKDYFGEDFPSIADLQKNLTLLLVARNRVMNSAMLLPPNIIEVDFMHVQEPKPLPKDLELILDNSKQGAVYFSLRTTVKSCWLPRSTKEAIGKALSALPYTVLWKWECEEVPNVSGNVITRNWFPQQDILGIISSLSPKQNYWAIKVLIDGNLAHPNVKIFVTQGGLQSSEEAIARMVPLVGIPVLGDQEYNVNTLVDLGAAVKLSLENLTSETLTQAILEIAKNKTYSKRMKELRDICFDQPMTGLERAVWWSEYVIRNKGAPALRSVLADVPLYEYLLLDVLAIFFVTLTLLFLALRKLISYATTPNSYNIKRKAL